MKAAGIVRRIDDLGRIVIPKEVRNNLRLREGEPVEIFVDNHGEVILKKYSPIEQLKQFAQEYIDVLHSTTKNTVVITDRDFVIAIAGNNTEYAVGDPITKDIEEITTERRATVVSDTKTKVITPIIAQGDVMGTVMLIKDEGTIDEIEIKLVDTAARFLAKNIEE
ncbi:stage V sporulation T C-terminal domain-containing protein [Bacillota bacterium LX-D]|nr:stage V sporulation T C-terminal domain-containing protein [Bacillota bacterium LX-D]